VLDCHICAFSLHFRCLSFVLEPIVGRYVYDLCAAVSHISVAVLCKVLSRIGIPRSLISIRSFLISTLCTAFATGVVVSVIVVRCCFGTRRFEDQVENRVQIYFQ
jgi:hypothetical protein